MKHLPCNESERAGTTKSREEKEQEDQHVKIPDGKVLKNTVADSF